MSAFRPKPSISMAAKEQQIMPTTEGALDYNYGLSQRRVDAVRRFLMDKGITLARIQSASLGPIKGGDIPDAKKRRVTLRLMVDPE